MCKFWHHEQSNHHFPELNRRQRILSCVGKFFTIQKIAIAVAVMSCVLGTAYLAQTNTAATRGYQIDGLETRLDELKEANKKLNLEYVEMQSMAQVIDRVKGLNMVSVSEMEILSPNGSSVALR